MYTSLIVTLIMPYFEKRIKRFLGAVLTVDAIDDTASCSGTIKQIVKFSATHSVKIPFDSLYDSIITQSFLTTALNRDFSAIGFEAIGGVA
ncbi:hypothetical protein Q5691_18845 [Microcoleus sp. w1-18aA5]|uniref:hypothetical protein n=1 Tax=Microcoleus sp. w1-18aA5 TaxID=2818982 RepID=UPI002FD3AE72